MRTIAGTARSMGIDIVGLTSLGFDMRLANASRETRSRPSEPPVSRNRRDHRWEAESLRNARREASRTGGANAKVVQEPREGRRRSSIERASTRSKKRVRSSRRRSSPSSTRRSTSRSVSA